jgi:hypothetical protein
MAKGKQNNYKFWHSPVSLIIIFCILVVFGYKIIDLIHKDKETSRKKELILADIDELKKREYSLTNDILKLETEEGKEQIIREKYQVAKQGEKMVTIIDNKNNDSKTQEEKVTHGFWNWIKKIFKKN